MRVKLISIASCILVLILVLGVSIYAQSTMKATGHNQSMINVCDYGAIPNDGKDDTLAFSVTASAGDSVYVPPGTYNITESIVVDGISFFGAGTDKTVIVADLTSTRDPIIWAGSSAQIRDITIKFADHCITGNELPGERCGILTHGKTAGSHLCRGAAISNVKIQNVGTGIYNPTATALKKIIPNASSAAFSVTFEGVSVLDFSYRGISMQSINRTGNVYRNIYLSSGKYEANTALFIGELEAAYALTDVTVADSKLKTAVRFCDSYSAQITNINIINTELIEDNTAFIYCDQSKVTINSLIIQNSAPKGVRQAFIRLGDAAYIRQYYTPNNGYLHIYNMSILNPETEVIAEPSQYMIARENKYINDFLVQIDSLRVVASEEIKAQYETFNYDTRGIVLTLEGQEK